MPQLVTSPGLRPYCTGAVLLLCLVVCGLTSGAARACAYNVRDVGFVDLDRQPYQLYAFIDGTTPEPVAAALGQAAYALFLESNVHVESVDLGATPDHAAKAFLTQAGVGTLPAAVLHSPSGAVRAIPLPAEPAGIRPALEPVLVSAQRSALMDATLAHYAVVLLVEGSDTAANERAATAISEAIHQMGTRMAMLPKKVDLPPILMTLPRVAAAEEDWLLWSLDMDPVATEPQAVVLYGRVRRMGPNLTGDGITALQVGQYLNVIGADCECGLDRRWMQGTMLPVAWDEARHTAAAASLQFDPEDPMVKMEISMALSKSAHTTPGATAPSLSSITYGYQETAVGDPETEATPVEAPPVAPAVDKVAPAPPATPPLAAADSLPLSTLVAAGIAGAVLLGAVVLVVLRRRES